MDIHFKTLPGAQGTPLSLKKQETGFETAWSLPPAMGSGIFRKMAFRTGFDLYASDYRVDESFTTCVEANRPAFGFGFWLSGKTIGASPALSSRVFAKPGDSGIYYYPDPTGTVTDLKGSWRRSVTVLVAPDLLHTLLSGALDHVPRDFKEAMDGRVRGEYRRNGHITPLMSRTLDQLLNCPFTGATRRLYLEGKAMELLALRLDQLSAQTGDVPVPGKLGRMDVDKIHTAAQALCHDLENPPSLFELAGVAGISHAKLNRGFRQVFGTTAFGYLRRTRLAQAKILLESSDVNVTEAALAVGYNSLSSFARAFRGQYGCSPHSHRGRAPADGLV